jgi:hypothetical protein
MRYIIMLLFLLSLWARKDPFSTRGKFCEIFFFLFQPRDKHRDDRGRLNPQIRQRQRILLGRRGVQVCNLNLQERQGQRILNFCWDEEVCRSVI